MSNDACIPVQSQLHDLVHHSAGVIPNEAHPEDLPCIFEQSSEYNAQARPKPKHSYAQGNIQKLMFQRQLTECRKGFMKQYMSHDKVIQKLQREARIKRHSGSVNALRWSTNGQMLLSGGNDSVLHIHSYPQYKHLCATKVEGGSIWDAAFLSKSNTSLLAGSDTGVITITHLPSFSCNPSVSQDRTVINCPNGSIFSVKPVERPELFFSACGDGTVRLFDARVLCTCNRGDTCDNNVILKDSNNCAITSLDVNPTNSFQFCISHGQILGVYDVRMCCESDKSYIQRYYIPCPKNKHSINNYSSNCATHVVYNSTGTELLLNTRTVGALLLAVDYHTDTALLSSTDKVEMNGGKSRDQYNTTHDTDETPYHDSTRQCIMICEDFSGTGSDRYSEQSGFMGQLSTEMRTWFSDRPIIEPCIPRQSESDSLQLRGVYQGHRNTRTLLKQAAFWGENHVVSASDCARIFLWNKTSKKIEKLLDGDARVTTCVQPHPFDPVLATSGLDKTIKIWAPSAQKAVRDDDLISSAVEENEMLLAEDEYLVPIPNTVVLRALSGVDPGDLLGGIL